VTMAAKAKEVHALEGLSFRLARKDPEDCRRFCELSNGLYARKVGPEYYEWQFFSPPHPSYLAFALTDRGDLAGCYGMHVLDLARGRGKVGMALDIMVAREFQGKGVFRALAEMAEEQLLAHAPRGAYVMANRRCAEVHVHGLEWTLVNVFEDCVCETAAGGPAPGGSLEFRPVEALDVAGSDGPPAGRQEGLLRIARGPERHAWRIHQNPRYRYEIVECLQGGDAFGSLTLKVFSDPATGEAMGDVVDLSWSEDSPPDLAEMLRFALTFFQKKGIARATTWLQTNTILDEVGRSLGFQRTQRRRYFCVKAPGKDPLQMRDPRSWCMMMLDSEVY
jgi:GNAT superfamily N-acetyltransferase